MSVREALLGYKLVTAKIRYMMPDHPRIVNPHYFLWQESDRDPDFPRLNRFLSWWDLNLDGKLVSVTVWVRGLIEPTDLKLYGSEFRLS